MSTCRGKRLLLSLALVWLLNLATATAKYTPYIRQSFFFDWNKEGEIPPIPVTEQCETIHIKWERSTALGPNPSAPYFLQVYSSNYTTPLIIPAGEGLNYDFTVPFAPGTQYQICMFDRYGNTGGCQNTYTMIPSSKGATNCSNITSPTPLGVESYVINGNLSRFGWIDQCTDISIVPTNGTPPYIFTVAPALHPPYNITSSKDNEPLNWTVILTWAAPFFISVVDSKGLSWANGPLHSGGGEFSTTGCLSGMEPEASVKPYVAVSSGMAGLVAGSAIGALVAWYFLRKSFRKRQLESAHLLGDTSSFGDAMVRSQTTDQYRPVPTTASNLSGGGLGRSTSLRAGHGYHLEPFQMPADEEGRALTAFRQRSPDSTAQHRDPVSPEPSIHNPSSASSARPNQVYVLHHDRGTAPVTIYTQEGTQIVELPPRYPPASPTSSPPTLSTPDEVTDRRSTSGSDGRTETTRSNALSLHQARQPGSTRKLPMPPS